MSYTVLKKTPPRRVFGVLKKRELDARGGQINPERREKMAIRRKLGLSGRQWTKLRKAIARGVAQLPEGV